jgi:succinyl-diaminopimelate desuccinylase
MMHDPLTRQLAEDTLALCAISSETGNEAALCDWLETRLATLPHIRVARQGDAIVAWSAADPTCPTIGLFGHTDTVKAAGDQPLAIREDRVYGCGASDMKGGLAVMLALLAAHDPRQHLNLVAVFYDKEEGPVIDNGLEPLLVNNHVPKLDFAVCLEPTDNRIQMGCVGGLHAVLRFEGQRAHSARPWQGASAITRALPFLQRLASQEPAPVQYGDLTFYEVMTATTAHTQNSRNVVPDCFEVNVNYRFAPHQSLTSAKEALLAMVGDEAVVTIVDEAPAGQVCLDDPTLTRWVARTGLHIEPKQAWTDVARLTARGIPAVNFGPGETAQAHQARESIPIAALRCNYDNLLGLLARH